MKIGKAQIEKYNLYIKKASLDDALKIANIKASAYADDRLKFKPDESKIPVWIEGDWYQNLSKPNLKETVSLINKYYCYIILLNEESIGTFWLHNETEDSLSLEDFCILPEYQGKGYGYKALTLMEKLFPAIKTWTLGTPYFCKRNRYLYEKFGYQCVSTRSDDTVVLYRKVLD